MRLFTTRVLSLFIVCAIGQCCGTLDRAGAQETTTDGGVGPLLAGVAVDADGVLRREIIADPSGQLRKQRLSAARATLNPKVANSSKLRKVSLNRLEQAIKERSAKQQPATDEMKFLAGLTRIQYVFYYPDTKDVVIAGPAEGWYTDPVGRVCGVDSGRPIVELQDLVVALRSFPPGGKMVKLIGCSIDPTPEGLANMQRFLHTVGSRATPRDTQYIVDGLQTNLGLQTIRVDGVAANTHFAQVMVEADYRMKLIGIGLERPPIKMASYVDLASPASVSRNAMQRWYFVPDYQCVRVSDDRMAMQLVGDGVKLVGANEMVAESGARHQSASADKAGQTFVETFTKKFPELAARSPIYAQLRNLVDLTVAAAYIQQNGFYEKAGWNLETLGNEKSYPVQTFNTPQKVATAVNAIWRGRSLMTPIGGGVEIQARRALQSDNLLDDSEGKVGQVRDSIDLKSLAQGQWWWD